MKKSWIFAGIAVLVLAIVVVAGGIRLFRGSLSGDNEIPIVYTDATGAFKASINSDETQIEWELSYSGLESDVRQAHIHVGTKEQNGGIAVWLCDSVQNPGPTDTVCPQSGTISGTISSTNVIGPASQGVSPGEFSALIRAIRDGNTYANVHTATSPGGEIRSQLKPGRGHRGHGDGN